MDREFRRTTPRARLRLRTVLRDKRAATTIEYGLIISLVVIVMVGALAEVGNVTQGLWDNVNSKVTNAH